ncbi:MAG: class I SAM-dependent methyltransferase [Saprospiraceae bacterium]|nr:class I SAM-dependent methyltransferase [Saprospiraceae bacterium]
MQSFWNERYAQEAYVYGESPNEWLRECMNGLHAGKILFPAEGEGRNAVYAAQCGWEVEAFDYSESGKIKADLLARKNGVQIHYKVADANEVHYPDGSLDAIAFIFTHFPSTLRRQLFPDWIKWLKPEGSIIFECFSVSQLDYQKDHQSGGPKDAHLLYSLDTIRDE